MRLLASAPSKIPDWLLLMTAVWDDSPEIFLTVSGGRGWTGWWWRRCGRPRRLFDV